MIRIGIVGLGFMGMIHYYGSRNLKGAKVTAICTRDPKKRAGDWRSIRGNFGPRGSKEDLSGIKQYATIDEMVADPDIDLLDICLPSDLHRPAVVAGLKAGKHVLVEKPLTATSDEGRELIRIAEANDRILMVGHVFEYNSTVQALKDLIDSGELGEIYYLHFERTNLGPVRTDVNALWDLASHDVSIMCYLLGRAPTEVTASGRAFINSGIEDTVFATFDFGTTLAHIHASWLNPRKVREITAVGAEKMAVWNDLDVQHPIRIYDKRIVDPEELPDSYDAYKTTVVDGGVHIPPIQSNQPLKAECDHFIECIEQGIRPRSDGYVGLRVLTALEAATTSMASHGERVTIEMPAREDDKHATPV